MQRFLAWKSWDMLCAPRSKGQLGFRKIKEFNQAPLCKVSLHGGYKVRFMHKVAKKYLQSER